MMLLLTSCGSKITMIDGTTVEKETAKGIIENELTTQCYSMTEYENYLTATFESKSKSKAKKLVSVDYKEMAKGRLTTYSSQYVGSKEEYKNILTGCGFSAKEAEYAVENVTVDYNNNALQQAQAIISDTIGTQKYIYDMLIDTYKYTEEESQYAIDNLHIDWGDAIILAVKQIKEKISNFSIEEFEAELERRGFGADEIGIVLDKGIDVLLDIIF